MRNFCLVLCLLAFGLTTGCPKSAGPPSPEYVKARQMWLDALREKRDRAFGDPAVPEILQLLLKVDPDSVDAPSALTLRTEIETGMAEAKRREMTLANELERARTVSQLTGGFVHAGPGTDEPAAPSASVGDGGVAADDTPKAGMTLDDFQARFGRCFEFRNDAAIGGKLGGQVWGLKDLGLCREKFKDFTGRSVVVFNGKVDSVRSNEEVTPHRFKLVEGKLVPAEDKDLVPPEPPKPPAKPAPTPSPGEVPQPLAPQMPQEEVPVTNLPITDQP